MNIAFEPMLASPLATVEQQGDMTPWKGWFRSGISDVALLAGLDRHERATMFVRMLRAVRRIPKGKVSSYGAVAQAAGYSGAARQVVWALRSPAARDAPWHRVVGAGGRILLPGEAGLEQRLRLAAEGITFSGARVLMAQHEYHFRKPKKAKKK
jgi:methylated-DNA-protein-cysteine methyltransferase-like protein